MDEKALAEALTGFAAADPDTFARLLNQHAAPLYQVVFNKGHATATAAGKSHLKTRDDEITRMKTEMEQARASLEQFQASKPDLAAVEEKYVQALKGKDDALARLKADHDKALAEWRDGYKSRSLDVAQGTVAGLLVREHGVDPVYAKVMARDPDLISRIRFDERGDITGALQRDGATPLPVPEGKSIYDALTQEVAKGIPARFKEDRRQGGSGFQGGTDATQRVWKESEIAKLSDAEYAKFEGEIDKAASEGRVLAGE